MKILFITQVWPSAGQDNMYSDLVKEFVDKKDKVCVTVLNEKRNKLLSGLTFNDGYYLLRTPCGNIQKTNKYNKVISSIFAGFSLLKYVKKYSPFENYDLIIWALSTTLIAPHVIKIKKKFSAKLYLLLKEYWPQDPCDLGAMKENGLIYRFFERVEKIMVTNSEYVGCCSKAGIKYITDRYLRQENSIEVCPNCEKSKAHIKNGRSQILEKYGIPDTQVVFLFGGNMGVSQGIDDMIACVSEAAKEPRATFLLLGSGTEFEKVKIAFNGKVTNVIVQPSVSQNDFFKLCCVCDVGMLFLFKDYKVPNIPGKFTTYLNAGMPILAAVDKTTDVGSICEENKCGYALLNGNAAEFSEKVSLLLNKEVRSTMHKNAKNLFISEYNACKCCDRIRSHFIM